jgi:hypothetical protein
MIEPESYNVFPPTGIQQLEQDMSGLLGTQHDDTADSMSQQLAEMEQRTNSVADHGDASDNLIMKELDELQARHSSDLSNTTEELRMLQFMEAQAQSWSQNNYTSYTSQLSQLKQELDMTLRSLANVQNLQMLLLNATLSSGQEQRSAELAALRQRLVSQIDAVNSSLSVTRSQLLTVDALIGNEQEQDKQNISTVLSDELQTLRSNLQISVQSSKNALKSQLDERMTQLRGLVSQARGLASSAKNVITNAVSAEHDRAQQDATAFEARTQQLEDELNDENRQQTAGLAALRAQITSSESSVDSMLTAADRNRHALLHDMEENVSRQVVSASTGLWSFLQKTIKNVDDAVHANMQSMNTRLPAERNAFDQKLTAVQSALTTATQAQQAHIKAQMLALRALSMQIDAVSDKAAMAMPAVRTQLAQLLAQVSALDAQRATESSEAQTTISRGVKNELHQMQSKVCMHICMSV